MRLLPRNGIFGDDSNLDLKRRLANSNDLRRQIHHITNVHRRQEGHRVDRDGDDGALRMFDGGQGSSLINQLPCRLACSGIMNWCKVMRESATVFASIVVSSWFRQVGDSGRRVHFSQFGNPHDCSDQREKTTD
jgi:hypothetical protein